MSTETRPGPHADDESRDAVASAPHAHDHDHERDDGLPGPWAPSRRTFLAAVGFAATGTLVGCSRPAAKRAVPGSAGSEAIVPGRATWYASTCGACAAGCGVLVKCRDGRPIKVEGNPEHPVSRGGLCAAGQAHVLGLYDGRRLRRPLVDGREVAWGEADRRVTEGLEAARSGGVRVLTSGATGPTTRAAIATFLARFPDGRHVAYDALSASAILAAHARTHGVRVLPRYRFEYARTVLGVEADFLGTWISPVEHTRGWRTARSLEGKPAHRLHVQVESAFSVTGGAADRRYRASPAAARAVVAHVAAALARLAALPAPPPPGPAPLARGVLDEVVERLWSSRPDSLVVCGINDTAVQALVNLGNEALGAYGRTVDVAAPSFQRTGDDAALAALVEEMEAGKVAALVASGVDPAADSALAGRFSKALARVPLRVALAERPGETTAGMTVVLPAPHALEAWDDAEPVAGVVSLTQPALEPFGEPRSLRACLAAWGGTPGSELDLLRAGWEREHHPRSAGAVPADAAWRAALQAGFARLEAKAPPAARFDASRVAALPALRAPAAGRLAVVLHATVGMLDGRHAHNPWLHELPDPVTKTVWDNVASLSPATARTLGVEDGDVVRVAAEGATLDLPALVQPGLDDGVVAIALGYGRSGTDRFHDLGPRWIEGRRTVERGATVGGNAAPFLRMASGDASSDALEATVTRTGARRPLARAQTWGTQDLPANTAPHGHERREIARQTTLVAWSKDPASGVPRHHRPEADLWPDDHAAPGPRWRMAIDLDACTGCSACVVACQAENNVPVVGRDEVLRRRDMAWIRLDRYYGDVPGAAGEVETLHQPMACHHCGNAPCETVCPVLATVHTQDGLNAQVYNRCVGTRYCANNCPWKVRRFNWFEYDRADPLEDLQLNPDVTVRSRGVMEKCSFCVQRIHDARAEAKRLGRPPADGDVRTACQQSCPAQAIVFGDGADPASAVSRLAKVPRHYVVLEELNVKPSVGYLTKVRDRAGGGEGARHG